MSSNQGFSILHKQNRCQKRLLSIPIVGQVLTGLVPLHDGDKASAAALMRPSDGSREDED